MKKFILYGTSGCHLCELAHEMIVAQQPQTAGIELVEVDISESETLFARYGLIIPVLRHPDDRELNWPFSARLLRDFLAS
ncbi:MAG: glutaredoxin family protein [Halioglobus sp.]